MNPSRCFSTAPLFFEFPPSACCTSFVFDPGSSLALLRFFRSVTRAPEESWTPRSQTSDGELVLSFPDFSGALPLSLPHDPRRLWYRALSEHASLKQVAPLVWLLFPPLFSSSPSVARQMTKRFQKWRITLERQEVRSHPSCK